MALLKLLYLIHNNIKEQWETPIKGWKMTFAQMNRRPVCGAVLCFALVVCGGCKDSKKVPENYIESLPKIQSAVTNLFVSYQIDGKAVKTRKVPSGDGKFSRIEQRISVAPEFNILNFNHDLSKAVAEFGATVIASEKSEDKSVTMHIKSGGVILQSIVFIVKKEKESKH